METQRQLSPDELQKLGIGQKGESQANKLLNTTIETGAHLFALKGVEFCLQKISPQDIGQLRTELENLPDEEARAIDEALSVLSSVRALENKKEVLQRATRKLEYIATAHESLKKLGGTGKINDIFVDAARNLLDAVSALATPQEQQQLSEFLGGMTEADIAKRRDELMKININ